MKAEAPIGWAAADFRRITLLFARPADARQAIESTPLLNFASFAGDFRAFVSFLTLLASPHAEGHAPVRLKWMG